MVKKMQNLGAPLGLPGGTLRRDHQAGPSGGTVRQDCQAGRSGWTARWGDCQAGPPGGTERVAHTLPRPRPPRAVRAWVATRREAD